MPSVREDGPGQTGSCISASAVNAWKPVSLMEIGFHRNVGLQVDMVVQALVLCSSHPKAKDGWE